MSVSGVFGKFNISKLEVHVDCPQEVFANTPAPFRVTLRNRRKIFPAFLIRLSIDDSEVFFPFVPTGGEATTHVERRFSHRGEHVIRMPHISSVFPFSFFTRYIKMDKTVPLIVFPQLKRCDLSTLYQRQVRARGERESENMGYDSDIISIRQYVQGDPFKYINWKATAKTGGLKTKEFASLNFEPMIVDFDKVSIRDVEEKVSCIAYTVVRMMKKNVPVGLKIREILREPGLSQFHRLTMLRDLALFQER